MRKTALAVTGLVSTLLMTGCALSSNSPHQTSGPAKDGPLKGDTLTVASKEFTEQLLLCEITAQRLESQGATVKRTCGMSGSNAVRAALTSGSVDMYWEYTGTGWLDLQQTTTVNDPAQMYQKVSAMDKAKNNVVWLPPAAANNTYAIAVKTDVAQKLGIKTISDYAKLAQSNPSEAKFCGASEFFGRDDGWPGVEKAYGFDLPKGDTAELAEGPIYNAVAKGNPCNFGEVFATDGRIAALKLTVLEDDKKFFPPYNLSLNVRGDVLAKDPEIASVMAPVSKLLTTPELQKLNAEIDVDGKTPEEVASSWLRANKLN
ncbi:glycine betaine ABC transporter substrate-binding protein [Nocardioides sp.]|jgi:osmoprotectant transport system substrate-binding protein|uniref:glycine betaine ABC transporter substrate-binding protein n=1 Tax=Nocardioides sp. TaxID=35761 RepID=UPI002C058980|nr:glycine betaine ABC transporter substrate-binding protein [Nocardioides sp.]HVX55956.1 glycine betaine ABC transporter substrate-binding protein [Nocardioides sp.]